MQGLPDGPNGAIICGTLGAAMMTRFTELKWAHDDSRSGAAWVNFYRNGEKRVRGAVRKSNSRAETLHCRNFNFTSWPAVPAIHAFMCR